MMDGDDLFASIRRKWPDRHLDDSFYSDEPYFQIHKIGEEEVAKLLNGSSAVIRDLGLNMTFKYVKVFFVQMKISTVKKFKDIKRGPRNCKKS